MRRARCHTQALPLLAVAEWEPWGTLRRREHLVFRLVDLPEECGGAAYIPVADEGWAAVLIDRALDRVERRSALTHELIHDERGGGCSAEGMPPAWAAVVARDEAQVDDEVARRLVPLDHLEELVAAVCGDLDVPVYSWDVADQFDVPVPVAERAMRLLAERQQERRTA